MIWMFLSTKHKSERGKQYCCWRKWNTRILEMLLLSPGFGGLCSMLKRIYWIKWDCFCSTLLCSRRLHSGLLVQLLWFALIKPKLVERFQTSHRLCVTTDHGLYTYFSGIRATYFSEFKGAFTCSSLGPY